MKEPTFSDGLLLLTDLSSGKNQSYGSAFPHL
jgi:hypothetical protein